MRIDVSEQRRAVHHPLQPLEQCEIDDRGERYAAPQRPVTAEKRMVAEREDRTRDVHHQRAQRKGEDHRQQDARQNGHRPRRIDIPADFDQRNLVVGGDDHRRNGQRRAQQAEDQRHGSRRGKAHRVVDVEQDDIGQHHREVEDHHVAEREPRRIEHAAARHLHHAGRRDGADDDSTDATAMITRTGAALEPMAELRKLAASFITPMKRPVTARSAMAANINVYIGSILSNSGKCGTKIAFSPAGNNSVTYS
jgi:hypothetical protein